MGFESSLSEPTKHTQAWGQDGRRTNKRKIGKIPELAFKKEEGWTKPNTKKKNLLTRSQELKIKEKKGDRMPNRL